MEESNCATSILGVLLHIEHFYGNGGRVQLIGFSVFEGSLGRGAFIEKNKSKSGLRDHLDSPVFESKEFLEAKLFRVEAHLGDEGVDDFGVGFEGHPVVVLVLHVWIL